MAVNEWVPMDTDDYTVGQVTLTAGSSDVTFTNAFNGAESSFYAGDSIYVPTAGKWLLLASITNRIAGTLLYPCPADCAGTFDLRLRPLSRNARQAGLAAMVLRNLQIGNLPALADLTLAPGQVPTAGQVQGSFVATNVLTEDDLSPYMKIKTYDPNNVGKNVYDAGNLVENTAAHNDKGALMLTNAERKAIADNTTKLSGIDLLALNATGTFIWFDGTTAPEGYLIRDGSLLKIADYQALYNRLGTRYGGDGQTTFGIGDFRGEFVRGLDLDRGVDVGRRLGTSQAQSMPKHRHIIGIGYDSSGIVYYCFDGTAAPTFGSTVVTSMRGLGSFANTATNLARQSYTSEEQTISGNVYPRNMVLLPCIKY